MRIFITKERILSAEEKVKGLYYYEVCCENVETLYESTVRNNAGKKFSATIICKEPILELEETECIPFKEFDKKVSTYVEEVGGL